MLAPTSTHDQELAPSRLGTKEHWDWVYTREAKTFGEIGDEGDIWSASLPADVERYSLTTRKRRFGEDSADDMVEWVSDNLPTSVSIVDGAFIEVQTAAPANALPVGTGNGDLIFRLFAADYLNLTGIDYSEASIDFSRAIAAQRCPDLPESAFVIRDIFGEEESSCRYGLACDKGTLDAISLCEEKVKDGRLFKEVYPERIAAMLEPGGIFLLTSSRTFLAPVASTVGGILDHSLGLDVGGGTGIGKGPIVASIHGALNTAETLALFGIEVGSEITKVGLGGMKSTVEYLEGYFGNDEALRALGAFLKLVEREWGESLPSDPEGEGGLGRWSMIQVAKAASTWAVLQNTTSGLDEARWAPELEELDLHTWGRPLSHRRAGKINAEDGVVFQVTEEQILEGGEEVIQASLTGGMLSEGETEDERTRFRLRRFSKICLGSYGGMGMIFFGVKLPSPFSQTPSITSPNTPLTNAARSTQSRSLDESSLAQAFGASSSKNSEASTEKEVQLEADDLEAEMAQLDSEWVAVDPELEMEGGKGPGLWGLLSGSHDTKVIEALGDFDAGSTFVDAAGVDEIAVPSPHTKAGRRPPRFFVVTDHRRHQVLLCLRGTMSIDDLATDLACELLPFPSEDFWDEAGDGGEVFKTYQVHGGMWEVALAMGHPRGAVTRAISKALIANPEYELYLMGHSLGAGVAALLGIMWTNPNSGLTSSKSGLPAGKHVQVYGFAPPCTTDAKLSVLWNRNYWAGAKAFRDWRKIDRSLGLPPVLGTARFLQSRLPSPSDWRAAVIYPSLFPSSSPPTHHANR
ncbi:EEF1A lysine methyltransferase 2, partial [Phenoliferia sp. Uapishka_3]